MHVYVDAQIYANVNVDADVDAGAEGSGGWVQRAVYVGNRAINSKPSFRGISDSNETANPGSYVFDGWGFLKELCLHQLQR